MKTKPWWHRSLEMILDEERKLKTISGFRVCACDARYRPCMMKKPNAYFVQCPNCGKRTPDVARPPYESHIAAQQQAQQDWNDGKRLGNAA